MGGKKEKGDGSIEKAGKFVWRTQIPGFADSPNKNEFVRSEPEAQKNGGQFTDNGETGVLDLKIWVKRKLSETQASIGGDQ
mmetsp:Transcript_10751/g.11723  ORF Transcript_10751/g.11723 Transcript_10751/m.11723 type:complete len:81 (+) Transcript_10751:272-514(+)